MSTNSPPSEMVNGSALAHQDTSSIRPWLIAGVVLGLGQGGFFDGIIFHQLLQWHHMFSSVQTTGTIAGMELNTLGDGLFHLLDWVLTLTGIALLWRAGRHPRQPWAGRVFAGSLLLGAGLFNLIEGTIDHHILGIHHLRPGVYQSAWDGAFLLAGVLLMALGWTLIRTANVQKAA
jgi:uncharacterized membrane protein